LYAHNFLIESAEFSGVDFYLLLLLLLLGPFLIPSIESACHCAFLCFDAVMSRCDRGAMVSHLTVVDILHLFFFLPFAPQDVEPSFFCDIPFCMLATHVSFRQILYTPRQHGMSFVFRFLYIPFVEASLDGNGWNR